MQRAERERLNLMYGRGNVSPSRAIVVCGTALGVLSTVTVFGAAQSGQELAVLRAFEVARLSIEQPGIAHAREIYRQRALQPRVERRPRLVATVESR
jgi:hypothetical protein